RETVGVAHRRMAGDLDIEVEIARHAPDDLELLVILRAENSGVRPDHVEELGDDRRYAAKVAGTKLAGEERRKALNLDRRLVAFGIDLSRRGVEKNVDVFFFEKRAVAREVARIGSEVLARRELRRVDEKRGDYAVAELFRRAHEREMAVVQRAHRGHERDALAGAPLGVGPGLHFFYGLDDAHCLRFAHVRREEFKCS